MHPIPVFYAPQMSTPTQSYSPSSGKPAAVMQDWQQHFDLRILRPEPAKREDFYLAHDKAYVDGVLDLEIDNGFRNRDPAVAASLPWTTGAMMSAAEMVYLRGA